MTGVEVILAALAAGSTAGLTDVVSTAVRDAYTGLRDALRRRLRGRDDALRVLEVDETKPQAWAARLGAHLVESGAASDADIVAAAQRLLAAVDPAGTAAGKYRIDASHAGSVHVGDTSIEIGSNHGAAGTFQAPVTFHGPPIPPARPEAG
jgi:hypothetical protein